MTLELIAIITVGLVLAGLILGVVGPALRGLKHDVGHLRKRMKRLETLFANFTGAGSPQ